MSDPVDAEGAETFPGPPPVFDCYCDFPGCSATAFVEVDSVDVERHLLPKGWGRFLVQVSLPDDPRTFDLCPEHFRSEIRGWMLEDPVEFVPAHENRRRSNHIPARPPVVVKSKKGRQKRVESEVDILEALEPKVFEPVEDSEEPELPEDEDALLFWHPPVGDSSSASEELVALG